MEKFDFFLIACLFILLMYLISLGITAVELKYTCISDGLKTAKNTAEIAQVCK